MHFESAAQEAPPETSHPRAFESFLSHLPLLRTWVKRRAPRFVDSEDIVQQTLLQAFRHYESFRFESSPSTWLCAIALNQIRMCARQRGLTPLIYQDPHTVEEFSIQDPSESPLARLERKEAAAEMRRAVAKLPPSYRAVVQLRDFHGLSLDETSLRLSLTRSAVKSRHHRARLTLVKCLQAKRGRVR